MMMRISIRQLKRMIRESVTAAPAEAVSVIQDVLRKHPNNDGHELWWGDHGKLILDVQDEDSRSTERYEWTGDSWVHWDSEAYYE